MTKSRSNATAPAAKGELVVGTGTDASTTLAVASTAGYVLQVDSAETTGLKWAAPAAPTYVGASMYYTSDITATNNTYTLIEWNTEVWDTDSLHSTVTNTSRITIPTGKSGKWLFSCDLRFAQNSTGYRFFRYYKNGVATIDYSGLTDAEGHLAIHLTRVLDLVAGDYVEVYGVQNSGGNLAIQGGSDVNRWQATYLGA